MKLECPPSIFKLLIVFTTDLYTGGGYTVRAKMLFCKATDYISTKRAHYHTVPFVFCVVDYETKYERYSRTMWSVTLRLLWFFSTFFMFFTYFIKR